MKQQILEWLMAEQGTRSPESINDAMGADMSAPLYEMSRDGLVEWRSGVYGLPEWYR
jgi:predicted transcriptional regulator